MYSSTLLSQGTTVWSKNSPNPLMLLRIFRLGRLPGIFSPGINLLCLMWLSLSVYNFKSGVSTVMFPAKMLYFSSWQLKSRKKKALTWFLKPKPLSLSAKIQRARGAAYILLWQSVSFVTCFNYVQLASAISFILFCFLRFALSGMDMEQRDYDSRTALHVAAAEGTVSSQHLLSACLPACGRGPACFRTSLLSLCICFCLYIHGYIEAHALTKLLFP